MGQDFTKPGITDSLSGIQPGDRESRSILDSTIPAAGNQEAYRMLTAFTFPRRVVKVEVPGIAKKIAQDMAGVILDQPAALDVEARPLRFRREYYQKLKNREGTVSLTAGTWVSWGVVQFRVRVSTQKLKGIVTREICVDRRFTLRRPTAADPEALKVSSLDLRTTMAEID